ncbi:sigma-54-dependent Fis family transcriptional regulator [Variovorax sp. JS1663]|uniref:sigma-54-dependent Fis family transcriptional regulator n=1 Tax=Variovorax sp. JS1663 TaxID=1851577 RepID=UPI000B3483E4|nr:sigma-54-dependent Fis family transcriptional regulator [Variovorax sp. JS1663]OUL98570.1 sigma-54-dependent Fis family transcriptional regulator [Variovorax sp. JS1663]
MVAPHRPLATARTWTVPAALPCATQPARTELIEQWHQRCSALGLTRAERVDFDPLLRSDLTVARERNQRLFTHAAPVMEMLFEQIVDTESMIVLADVAGTILHSVGDDRFLQRADKVALAPGVNWAEHSRGTNAIGTTLFEEAPTVVHGDEHFIHANSFLTCSAAPIFDPRGNMLGVLDVTGDQRSYHQHTMGLVRMSARMIENQWLSDDYGNRLRLHFHTRAEFIGTLLEGIIVVGADGKVLGANRSALDQLGLSSAALRMYSLTSLFGITVSAVFDHFRAPLPMPMTLSLSSGRQFHVNARFNGPQRSMVLDAHGSEAATDVIVNDRPARKPSEALAGDTAHSAQGTLFSGLHYLNTGDPQIGALVQKVQRVLNRDIPLLILGETGTGKELLARAVHQDSNRAKQPFVAVNCASIPESLIEAELFGYEDGAFTGARRKGAVGRIVQANGGTLFLDEIGDMPLALQARLLRVLQERNVTPLGSLKSIPVDIAVIGATHRKLREMIEAGSFREDLYYRLNGLVVKLPALRDRRDLDVVARRILLSECPHATPEISASVMALFKTYAWPGNVRQLANVLRTAVVMAAGEAQIEEHHLSDDFLEDARDGRPMAVAAAPASDPLPPGRVEWPGDGLAGACSAPHDLAVDRAGASATPPAGAECTAAPRTLGEAEIDLIRNTLSAANGNISEASKRLGISRNTIYRKLKWGKES